MKKILILGGTRYLGKSIVNKIENNSSFDISTLSRSKTKTNIKHFVCNRKNTSELKKILINFNPNIILDMINFDGSDSNQISELYKSKILNKLSHYIMISSFFIYNYFDYKLFSEKKINNNYDNKFIDTYTKQKIESEIELYSSEIMNITTILRLPFIFSADDYTNRFQRLCDLSRNCNSAFFNSKFKFSLIRKDDAANAIIKIFNLNPKGIVDLSNKGYATNKKLIQALTKSLFQKKFNKYDNENNFPYLVNKDICLNSKKMTINLPIIEAIKNEAEIYWSLKYK